MLASSVASASINGASISVNLAIGVVGGVDASKNGIADVVSARLSVVTFSLDGIVNTHSGLDSAAILSARNSIVAVLLEKSNASIRSSFGRSDVADPGVAFIVFVGAELMVGKVSASTKVGVAKVVSAVPVVLALVVVSLVFATFVGSFSSVARIVSAVDVVRAVDKGEVAHSVSSAEVDGANIVILAHRRVGQVDTLSEFLAASIESALEVVVARSFVGFELTRSIHASIRGASKIVIAIHSGLKASSGIRIGGQISSLSFLEGSAFEDLASSKTISLFVAPVVSGNVLALSKSLVANVFSAILIIVAKIIISFVDAFTSFLIAGIDSALNAIVTVNGSVEASVGSFHSGFSFGQRFASIDSAGLSVIAPFVHGNSNATSDGIHAGLFGIADKFVSAIDVILADVDVDGVKASVSSKFSLSSLARVGSALDMVIARSLEVASSSVVSLVVVGFVGQGAAVDSASS